MAISSVIIIYFNSKLNKEWIKKDEIMIKEILPILYKMPDMDSLLNVYNFNDWIYYKPIKKELGLGYLITNFVRYGAYTTIYVYVLRDENNIAINSIININGNKRAMKLYDKMFELANIQEPEFYYGDRNTGIIYKCVNTDLYEKYINDYRDYFQINNNIYIPDEIKNEYELLCNARIYGYKTGFDGELIPEERKAFKKILETNNKNILFAIISSPNPEGRMYAIEGLFNNRINDIINENEYEDILEKMAALNCQVRIGWYDVIEYKNINSREDIYNLINNIIEEEISKKH
jgi:hypothetical protein